MKTAHFAKSFLLCLFASVLTLASAQAQADHSAVNESKLVALENAWNQAQLHHDAQALGTLVSDSFVLHRRGRTSANSWTTSRIHRIVRP